MNAALRKEARLLLPAWIAALAASTLPVWVVRPGFFQGMVAESLILFAAGALLLSLSSFGMEMSFGTFPSLLAQPRPRLETWQLKIGLLALAMATVTVVASFSWWLRGHVLIGIRCLPLLAVLAFAGGLWTTLLFRQTVTAFWFAILVPVLLYRAAWPMTVRIPDDGFAIASLLTCCYAVAGYFLARWLFLHAQDMQEQETTDSAAWSFMPSFPTPRRPLAALLVKELRLQQGTLVIAVVLVVLHLAAVAAAEYFPRAMAGLYSLLPGIWMLWWVAPWLSGCAAVAEERRGRTLESTLCLPVGRLRQFVIKTLVVFGLGLFLGAVMPWLLEMLRPVAQRNFGPVANLSLRGLLITAASLAAIGCYASSLSGTLLQALGATLVFGVLLPVTINWAGFAFGLYWPVLIAISICLSYANFKQLQITWRQWLRNGAIWFAAIFTMKILMVIMGIIFDWVHNGWPLWKATINERIR